MKYDVNLNDFTDIDSLEHWLQTHHIDTTNWGQANAKTVADLWQELVLGESRLQAAPVMRLVDVTNLLVRQNGSTLREAGQELGNGQVRRRNTPPAEKMRPGENVETAARRCLFEELHLDESAFLSEPLVVQTQTRRRDSPSYPGLPSCFTIHTVEVQVHGLPTGDFSTLNRAFGKGDPVRVHHWCWLENSE